MTAFTPRTPSRRLAARSSIVALVLVSSALIAPDATAVWPPSESFTAADMADPKNWPNDPGYGYDKDHNGQWNYYSFMPVQTGDLTLRPEETVSGMSIDLAWRFTQGDDRVLIAVTDSGIKWHESELVERAWLNPGELANHKPTTSTGGACGGVGALAGLDCNGDGILSASDYKDTASLEPPPTDGRPRGDKNQNGLLDAGDLIQNFSDGIDDDKNGYADDISGWDFMKDDNDPYDDTHYGHGTGEANDSTGEGNNGAGGIGGCHKCRFIAMRVGDSFIADANAFGQAVVYATDNGARVVQCALGTINMSRFAQQALDYAYTNGTLTIASMADENARHHNMPVTANHTLPVHAITYSPGGDITNAETFLEFNTCTNYGGQNFLSASGTACSSEATGQLSGISGLVMSAALKYGVTPPLTAAEAQQLFLTTADDIDVPESRQESPRYFWSQPGFDQRFGYGRVNANRAVENLKDGKIPPEVDVVRPFWFEVLYKDQISGPVEIQGHVSATRATSYDYTVEWAPGVQPLDADFKEIQGEKNVPAKVVTGQDGPIATFDVRTIDPTHKPDVDSPRGENKYTITVRIRAVAHYGGAIGDVPGEMRRTYYVYSDPDLVKGFPIYVGDSGEGSPKLADLDGDGVRDLIYPTSGGQLLAYKLTGDGPEPIVGFPFTGARVDGLLEKPIVGKPNYLASKAYASKAVDASLAGDSFSNAPAIADLDGDGTPEVVASSYNGNIYVIEHDGSLRAGWPVRMPEVPSCPTDGTKPAGPCMDTQNIIDTGAFASPVLADMDKDGDLDIIQAAFDGKVYVYDRDGAVLDGWPVTVHYDGPLSGEPKRGRILTTPAVADFNDDGYPELLVGSNERLGKGEQSGAVYLIDGRGTNAGPKPWLTNWPVTMTSFYLFPLVAEGVANSGVIGRFGGELAGVIHGNASSPLLLPLDPGKQPKLNETPANGLPAYTDPATGNTRHGLAPSSTFGELTQAYRPNTMFPLFGHPSLGDVDQDGEPDVIASGSSLNLAIQLQGGAALGSAPGEHLLAIWSGKTGNMMPASPYVLEDYSFFNSHAVVDLNGDDYPEVVVGSGGYYLHAIDACGREPKGWPKFTGQWLIPTPAVGDLDGDGTLEVVTGSRNGWLYAWHTEGRADGIIEWESYHHDNRNTGNLETALTQGTAGKKAKEPMTVELCTALLAPAAGTDPLEASGGCDCTVGPGARTPTSGTQPWRGVLAASLALSFALAARRRVPTRAAGRRS
ncbi:MAG: alkaline serine protease [Myxococcales bacterium]|nr:alkaline serine protease [Myxococcales bacterium]